MIVQLHGFEAEDSHFIDILDENILVLGNLSKEYSDLFVQIEQIGEEFAMEFGDNFAVLSGLMSDLNGRMKKKIDEIRVSDQKVTHKQTAQLYI